MASVTQLVDNCRARTPAESCTRELALIRLRRSGRRALGKFVRELSGHNCRTSRASASELCEIVWPSRHRRKYHCAMRVGKTFHIKKTRRSGRGWNGKKERQNHRLPKVAIAGTRLSWLACFFLYLPCQKYPAPWFFSRSEREDIRISGRTFLRRDINYLCPSEACFVLACRFASNLYDFPAIILRKKNDMDGEGECFDYFEKRLIRGIIVLIF